MPQWVRVNAGMPVQYDPVLLGIPRDDGPTQWQPGVSCLLQPHLSFQFRTSQTTLVRHKPEGPKRHRKSLLPVHLVQLAPDGSVSSSADQSFHIQTSPFQQRAASGVADEGNFEVCHPVSGSKVAIHLGNTKSPSKTLVFNGLVPTRGPGTLNVPELRAAMEADADNQRPLLAALCLQLEKAVEFGDRAFKSISKGPCTICGAEVFLSHSRTLAQSKCGAMVYAHALCLSNPPSRPSDSTDLAHQSTGQDFFQDRHERWGGGGAETHPLVSHFLGSPCPVSVTEFVHLMREAGASHAAFVAGAILVQKLSAASPCPIFLHSRNFRRLLTVAFMLAAKTYDDCYQSNRAWAEIGGITLRELNELELLFFKCMGWGLLLKREEYEYYTQELRPLAATLAHTPAADLLAHIPCTHGLPFAVPSLISSISSSYSSSSSSSFSCTSAPAAAAAAERSGMSFIAPPSASESNRHRLANDVAWDAGSDDVARRAEGAGGESAVCGEVVERACVDPNPQPQTVVCFDAGVADSRTERSMSWSLDSSTISQDSTRVDPLDSVPVVSPHDWTALTVSSTASKGSTGVEGVDRCSSGQHLFVEVERSTGVGPFDFNLRDRSTSTLAGPGAQRGRERGRDSWRRGLRLQKPERDESEMRMERDEHGWTGAGGEEEEGVVEEEEEEMVSRRAMRAAAEAVYEEEVLEEVRRRSFTESLASSCAGSLASSCSGRELDGCGVESSWDVEEEEGGGEDEDEDEDEASFWDVAWAAAALEISKHPKCPQEISGDMHALGHARALGQLSRESGLEHDCYEGGYEVRPLNLSGVAADAVAEGGGEIEWEEEEELFRL